MQVTDPVCGMQIDNTKAAASETVEGQTYYFCSEACYRKFRADPHRYVKNSPAGKSHGCHCC